MSHSSSKPSRTARCTFCGLEPRTCPHLGPDCAPSREHSHGNDDVTVVAAVVERDGRLLLCRRPAHKRHGGLWEFPGGKVLPDETLGEALQRELAEELQLELESIGEQVGRHRDPGSPFVIYFVEVSAAGEPISLEHEQIEWVAPRELDRVDLAPSDRSFVRSWRKLGRS